MKNYDDIIHLLHPVSQIYPQMPMYKRAAQFLPFSALTGYHDSIQEAARLIEQKRELNEDQIHNIRQNLNYIHDVFKLNPKEIKTDIRMTGRPREWDMGIDSWCTDSEKKYFF